MQAITVAVNWDCLGIIETGDTQCELPIKKKSKNSGMENSSLAGDEGFSSCGVSFRATWHKDLNTCLLSECVTAGDIMV